jgi:FkbM family methyltransferase
MTLRLFNTPLGKFNVLTNDVAFYECLSKGNSWDYHTIVKLLKNIPEEGNIIDVGGHIGTHAIPYSIHKNKSHIYTLEPQSYIRDILIKNMKENSITNMTILPYGAGHMNCNVKLANDFTSDGYDPNLTINYNSETNQNFGGLGITNDPLGEEIKLVTIDSLGIKPLTFVASLNHILSSESETILLLKPLPLCTLCKLLSTVSSESVKIFDRMDSENNKASSLDDICSGKVLSVTFSCS